MIGREREGWEGERCLQKDCCTQMCECWLGNQQVASLGNDATRKESYFHYVKGV